jgi:spore maturation protein CgeB
LKILISYRGIPQSPGWATGDIITRALRRLGHEVSVYARYYKEDWWIEDPACRFDSYDLHLFLECNDGEPQYLELCSIDAKQTACWLFDTSYYSDQCEGLIRHFDFDHVFLANPLSIEYFKSKGFNPHYLPYAADPELHYRDSDYPKTRDVVLAGSIREDRINLKNQLKEHGVELELISGVFREEYINALASARIVINQNPKEGLGLLNMRHFEAQAAGCFLIEQWCDLKPNINAGIVCTGACFHYYDIKDIAGICKEFLHDAEDLTDLVNSEKKYFLMAHTYDARCKELLETIC